VRAAWIIPKKDRSTLVRRAAEQGYRDGAPQLVEIGPVPVPPLAPHALDVDADLLVYAERSRLHVVRGLGGGGLTTQAVELPRGAEVHALVLIDGVVYAGGSSSGEVLGRVDLGGEARWERIEVPREVLRMGKGIDGFALHGGRLVAVDDMILPRYLLLYDVADPRAPRFLEARDLKAHSTGESVIGVASNERAIALLSTSANHGFFGVHVALLDLETLEERAVLHAEKKGSLRQGHGPVVDFSSVGLSDEALLIAAGAAGIGVIELGRWLSAGKKPQVIPFEAVRFVPVQGGSVIGVEPVDGSSAFAIVASEGGVLRRRTLDAVLVALG
jgi:hypothetical protein